MPGASRCCRPSAARRWPPLDGQPSVAFAVGPVDCQLIWTACRVATPLLRGAAPRMGSSAVLCATDRRQLGVSPPLVGWCSTLDRNRTGGSDRGTTERTWRWMHTSRPSATRGGPRRRGRDMSGHGTDPATETFVAYRNLLFTVAYEMLGSAADAEDVLQETWLRWVKSDLGQVRDQRAYLVRITTRQSLDRLRTIRRRREAYVGPWLPEPLLTAPDVAEDVELAESVSMALMLVLETLAPTERAVFVLREVFA